MAQNVTLGGDRLGSGHKQQVELHNYGMNSFNLEQDWKSSMAPGILYPFIKLVGTNHGTFDIDLDTFVRTIPTKGPLFGSFKLQLDLFNVPIRLYQGILHNNPVGIGLKMNQVYLPKLELKTVDGVGVPTVKGSNKYNRQINESALLKYLGLSGIGVWSWPIGGTNHGTMIRKFNAIPALAYYDIFKCYYSNKQEEKAYVITPGTVEQNDYINKITYVNWQRQNITIAEKGQIYPQGQKPENEYNSIEINGYYNGEEAELASDDKIIIQTTDNNWLKIKLYENTLEELIEDNYIEVQSMPNYMNNTIVITIREEAWSQLGNNYVEVIAATQENAEYTADIKLQEFDLANIDEMRNRLLSSNTLGQEFVIDQTTDLLPYSALVNQTTEGITWNAFTDNGLVVKTYQSDLFNNWLDSEIVDGENGIAAISAVAVTEGSFTIDSLNFAQKIYEVLNRVAVSGGTYEDWQEAVYGEGAVRKAETPMYVGGMAAEIMFEEVISSSETNVNSDYQPLGSLAGKGTQVGKKGGNNIHIKCDEPSYIMGIVSITPRICYSQGNDWDLTELDTLDDLHKPGLDGIGFQDLLTEQMAWFDRSFVYNGQTHKWTSHPNSAGKQTAWINYQTAIDKCYGDFARQDGYSFMVLNRNYEMANELGGIKDLTTYIDPSKYNYAFAYTDLAAQNFWVQIHSKVTARRKMGAQQIPNL